MQLPSRCAEALGLASLAGFKARTFELGQLCTLLQYRASGGGSQPSFARLKAVGRVSSSTSWPCFSGAVSTQAS